MCRFAPWVIVLVLLASCGGGTSATSGDAASGTAEIEYHSPIAEFLGIDYTDNDAMEQRFELMEAEAEQRTAECMAELGFEYVPRDISGMIVSFGGDAGLDYGSDEWTATYGFGISTMRFPQSMVGPDLVGFPDEDMPGPFDEDADPNRTYLAGLTAGEREAYEQALYGLPPDFDPSTMTDAEAAEAFRELEPTGCAIVAREEVFNEDPGIDHAFFEAFGDQLEALDDRVEADRRIIDAQQSISSCVAAKGLDYPLGIDGLYERYESRLDSIGIEGTDPFAGTGLDPSEMNQEEIDDFLADVGPPRLSDDDLAILAEVQADEIQLALAAAECGGGLRAQQQLYEQVRVEYEQRFLDENADELEQFRPGA